MIDSIGQKSWAITAMASRKSSCHIFTTPLKLVPHFLLSYFPVTIFLYNGTLLHILMCQMTSYQRNIIRIFGTALNMNHRLQECHIRNCPSETPKSTVSILTNAVTFGRHRFYLKTTESGWRRSTEKLSTANTWNITTTTIAVINFFDLPREMGNTGVIDWRIVNNREYPTRVFCTCMVAANIIKAQDDRDMGWQWHQLDNVHSALQTDKKHFIVHFYEPDALPGVKRTTSKHSTILIDIKIIQSMQNIKRYRGYRQW